jgi:hypothetical protein
MFDFSHLNDSQLMELIDDIPTYQQIGDDAQVWAELRDAWLTAAREDLVRRQTRRILVEIRCVVAGHNYLDTQVFTGTTREFAAAFGMRPKDRPFAPTGQASGHDSDGRPCEMTWQPA